MCSLRILFGLSLIVLGGIGAVATGFEMMLTAAYGARGLAFAFCMATALASIVLCAGYYVLVGRLPGFMTYVSPSRAGGSAPPLAPRPRDRS